MNYIHGEKVFVTDREGEKIEQRVWLDDGKTVYIASENLFTELDNGEAANWLLGVPRADVKRAK